MDVKRIVEQAKTAAALAAEKAKEIAAAAAAQANATAPAPAAEQAGLALSAPAVEGEEATSSSQEVATLAGVAEGDLAVSSGQEVARVAAAASAKISELAELGSGKIQELVSSFQQALPALGVAGYEITELEIELGLTPKLIPHFRYLDKAQEDVERAQETLRHNKLGMMILNGLLKAGEVQRQIKIAGFSFAHVEIELGLIPCVRLQYKAG